ncbi:MAG: Lrp/AsnC family transcriptional regulator [Desulfobacterales bacterium]|nr:Lrp/AsnC family transcriptional regulator [Desulfobacterales bacterium]
MNLNVDDIDEQIIKILNTDGRTRNTEIAKELNLSETAIRKRIKKLLDDEVIQIVAVINQEKLGYIIGGNIKIKTDIKKTDVVINALNSMEGIWYIAHLTGAYDFDVEFRARSNEELNELIQKINFTEGVLETHVSFRLKLIRNRNDWEK